MSILGASGQPIQSPNLLPKEPDQNYNAILEPFRFKGGAAQVMGTFCNVKFSDMPKEDLIALIGLREMHWALEMKKAQTQARIDISNARRG